MKYRMFWLWMAMMWISGMHAQAPAGDTMRLYTHTVRARMAAEQLPALRAFQSFDPYKENIKLEVLEARKRYDRLLDSILLLLPPDKSMQKTFLRLREKWMVFLSYYDKDRLTSADWEMLLRLKDKMRDDLADLEKDLASLAHVGGKQKRALKRLDQANTLVARAFLAFVTRAAYEKPVVSDKPLKNLKKASAKVRKTEKFFLTDEEALQTIRRMKADLNTFDMGMRNMYDPRILFSPYTRFNAKVYWLAGRITGIE
ncbi:MAG: hypothetical protein GXO27_06100 [Chlorobi bacterium]|nr:hypothetical protein [Chlorobiota bacterium]